MPREREIKKAVFNIQKPTVYIQVSPKQVSLRDARSGESLTTSPEIAMTRGGKPKVLGFGAKARHHESRDVQVINPFAHPRTLLGDFVAGEQLLRTLLRKLPVKRSMFTPAPTIVLHLQGDPQGGFTSVEVRAFREMALAAGASEVVVWQGPNLSDQQLLARQFPKEGQVLS